MPTKLPRLSITLTPDLHQLLMKEAAANYRPLANQITFDLVEHFSTKSREAELFSPGQLREAREPKGVSFQDEEDLPKVVRAARAHHSSGPDQSE